MRLIDAERKMRLIDADVLIEQLERKYSKLKIRYDSMSVLESEQLVKCSDMMQNVLATIDMIEEQPTVLYPKKGKWKHISDLNFMCSECGWIEEWSRYCPNCGARMEDE